MNNIINNRLDDIELDLSNRFNALMDLKELFPHNDKLEHLVNIFYGETLVFKVQKHYYKRLTNQH